MLPLRRGAAGSAVADVRRMLASIGLLDNTSPERADLFDDATELAVRHFQQRRKMSVDPAGQTITEWSSAPLTSHRPSGAYARARTGCVCPW